IAYSKPADFSFITVSQESPIVGINGCVLVCGVTNRSVFWGLAFQCAIVAALNFDGSDLPLEHRHKRPASNTVWIGSQRLRRRRRQGLVEVEIATASE